MSERAGEFLDDIFEIVLVDVVNRRRLVLVEILVVDLLLWLRRKRKKKGLVISFLVYGSRDGS